MSFQPSIPGLFSPTPAPSGASLLATEKQIAYAMTLAQRTQTPLPKGITQDRAALSKWIEAHRAAKPQGRFSGYPSSKQVAFAERIARLKRNPVPPECFRDRTLMARWIDSNKPR